MDATPLILADGCRTEASGRVIAVDGEMWFDPPLPKRAMRYLPGHEPAPQPSGLGVRVENVDVDGLERRREKDAAVEGWAHLAGVWRNERLVVGEQSGPRFGPRGRAIDAAGPVPPGGWSRDFVERVRAPLDRNMHKWLLYSVGETQGEEGQVVISVKASLVLPVLAEFLATLPNGLIQLSVWLRPTVAVDAGTRTSRACSHIVPRTRCADNTVAPMSPPPSPFGASW